MSGFFLIHCFFSHNQLILVTSTGIKPIKQRPTIGSQFGKLHDSQCNMFQKSAKCFQLPTGEIYDLYKKISLVVLGPGVQVDFSDVLLRDICPKTPRCNSNSMYRMIDGSCNNLVNPKFGQVFTPLQRLIPNAYSDGELLYFLVVLSCNLTVQDGCN